MHVVICDLCKKTITGVPQGEGEGNPDRARAVIFSSIPDGSVHMDLEVCWVCFEQIVGKAESLREDE